MYSEKGMKHELEKVLYQIEKLQLELKLALSEKEKAEIEAKYWREKGKKHE